MINLVLLILCTLFMIEISDLTAQNIIYRFSSQTSQICRSVEIINPNILYRRFYATFKYLKEVILNNKVQITNCELYKNQNIKIIIKWRNDRYGQKSICLESNPKINEG